MQGVGGAAAGGGIGGAPYKKNGVKKKLCARGTGVQFFFYSYPEGPKGPPGGWKATSPPQELEVGARRAP